MCYLRGSFPHHSESSFRPKFSELNELRAIEHERVSRCLGVELMKLTISQNKPFLLHKVEACLIANLMLFYFWWTWISIMEFWPVKGGCLVVSKFR